MDIMAWVLTMSCGASLLLPGKARQKFECRSRNAAARDIVHAPGAVPDGAGPYAPINL